MAHRPRGPLVVRLLRLALLVLVPASAWASRQGGAGALAVLGALFVVPVALLVVQLALTLRLTFGDERRRRLALLDVSIAVVTLALVVGGPLLVRSRTLGAWGWGIASFCATSLVVSVTHLAGPPTPGRHRLRRAAWLLPVVAALPLVAAQWVEASADRARDEHLVARLSGHFLGTFAAAYDGDGTIIAVGRGSSAKRHLQRWRQGSDGWTMDPIPAPLPESVEAGALHLGAGRALVGGDGVWLVQLADPAATRRLPDASGVHRAVAISPDGALGAAGGHDGTITVWSLERGATLQVLRPLEKSVEAIAVAHGLVAAGGHGPRVVVLDARDGALRCQLDGSGTQALRFADAETLLVGAGERLRRWRLEDCSLGPDSIDLDATALALSPDGQSLAVGDHRSRVRLHPYPIGAGAPPARDVGRVFVRKDPYHLNGISSIVFHPDRPELLVTSRGNHDTIAVFRLESAR